MDLMKSSISAIIKNIETAETYLDEKSIENFMNIINESDNVFVIGAGRSGLVGKAFVSCNK